MAEKQRNQIKFTVDGVDYTLEYTPRSVRKMEENGFDFSNMESHIVNVPYDLFRGAFISRHNYVPIEKRDELYEILKNTNIKGQSLLECLSEMLKDELEYIVSKPKGNVEWTMV